MRLPLLLLTLLFAQTAWATQPYGDALLPEILPLYPTAIGGAHMTPERRAEAYERLILMMEALERERLEHEANLRHLFRDQLPLLDRSATDLTDAELELGTVVAHILAQVDRFDDRHKDALHRFFTGAISSEEFLEETREIEQRKSEFNDHCMSIARDIPNQARWPQSLGMIGHFINYREEHWRSYQETFEGFQGTLLGWYERSDGV